jgi:hemerythrin
VALFEWSNTYSVSVATIDQQHQKLFAIMNELHAAMREGKGAQQAPRLLKELVKYTREHCAFEESLMERGGYPDLAAHKALHEKLTAEVVQMAAQIEGGDRSATLRLVQFLSTWLQKHILGNDKKYTPYVTAAPARR